MKTITAIGFSLFCLFSQVYPIGNIVDINIIRSADMADVDTIYVDSKHQIQILIENNCLLSTFWLPFKIYTDDDLAWTWDAQPGGEPDTGLQAVTIIPGSRADAIFQDMGSSRMIFIEDDMNGNPPDTIEASTYFDYGLTPGPLEAMYAYHFTAKAGDFEGIYTLCIDTFDISGRLLHFFNMPYLPPPINPQYTGPYCWPVKRFIRGDFDMDGEITVGDPVEIIQFIFQGKPNSGPIEAGDANCDGDTNVGDAIYLIAYIFQYGPAPGCP